MRSALVISVALAGCGGSAGAAQPCFPAPAVSEYAARIYGVVLAVDGHPLRDVRVTATSESPVEQRLFGLAIALPPSQPDRVTFEATTDELGRYRLLVQPAAYLVSFDSDDVSFSWAHVAAGPGAQTRLDVDLGALRPPPRARDASAEPHVSPRVATCAD